jgi:hypothetical protein
VTDQAPTIEQPAPARTPSPRALPQFGEREPVMIYRAVSRMAVASCVLGLMSFAVILSSVLMPLPLVGLLCGMLALWKIRARSDELTGETLALAGVALSTLCLAGGAVAAVYFTDVPSDARRITYEELQPESDAASMVPDSAKAFDGQRVYLRGFMYPGQNTRGIKEFVMCYSNDDCCSGGTPKLTHMVLVKLQPPLTAEFTQRARGVAGTFRIGKSESVNGLAGAIYSIEADYIQ